MAFDYPDALGSLVTSVLYSGHGNGCNDRLYYPFGEFWTGVGNCGWGITGTNTPSGNMHQTFGQLPDYDPEIDLYNTLNRHYSGNSGRWLSPDPAGLAVGDPSDPQTWNMYAYARNNPTTFTDPTGLVCASMGGNAACNAPAPNSVGILLGNDIFDAITGQRGTYYYIDAYGQFQWGVVEGSFANFQMSGGELQEWVPGTFTQNGDTISITTGHWETVSTAATLAAVGTAGAELGPADVALVGGTAAAILLYKNKDAIRQIVPRIENAALHVGKLLNSPDWDPNRNKWRKEVRTRIGEARKWANGMSPGFWQNVMNALIDQVEWAVPED
jgi:RHS repeat-associated protein